MTPWYVTLWQHEHTAVQWLAVAAACLIAAVSDLRSRRIPNALTFTVFLGGLAFATMVGGAAGVFDALAGASIAMSPFVLLFIFAGGGAGDAKLMAAVGAWTGVIGGLLALGATLIAGGIAAVVVALMLGRLRDTAANVAWMVLCLRNAVLMRGRAGASCGLPPAAALSAMPYGPAIFLGVCAAGGFTLTWQGSI